MKPDGWERVEGLLARVERPARYIDHEWGAKHVDDADYRAVLLYPDAYELGMANQALAILYERLNSSPGLVAERCFVPWVDMADEMRAADVRLFGLESGGAVADADLLGITLPYELTYTNVLEALDLAGIPLRSADRTDAHPLVIGGGPCVFNPEPVAEFFDALLIGEGEEAVLDIVASHRRSRDAGRGREETVRALAEVSGVYVPALYEPAEEDAGAVSGFGGVTPALCAPEVVHKRVLVDLRQHRSPTCPVVPFMDVVHDRATIEVLRGCTRGCRFCQAGMVYRPVRERGADEIVRDALATLRCTGYDEVSLTSLSSADHSQIEEVLRRLTRRLEGRGVSVSLPSLRVDSFSVDMARLVGASRKSGLTFAPEAGTQRLRDVINKNVTEDDLLTTVTRAFEAGWRRLKLYFMVGLPTETDADVVGIAELVRKVRDRAREVVPPDQRGAVRLAVSVSVLVPKPHTPFQWEGQVGREEVERRQGLLRGAMPRHGVELSWHDPEVSFVEAVLARGGRRVSRSIEAAWRSGARFDAWTERFSLDCWSEAFSSAGIDADAVACESRGRDERLPWSHISSGVSPEYLWRERERALDGRTTPDCSFDGCTACEACDVLGVDVVLGGERGGG